jgi:hypothetical protein
MNKSLARCLQLISFIWLIHSPLLLQPVNASKRNNVRRTSDLISAASLVSRCTPHQQIVIAIMLEVDITLNLSSFGFCQSVIDIITTCPRSEWIRIAISLHLTAVVDIAVRFKAVSAVYPVLFNVVGSMNGITGSACGDIFSQISYLPVLVEILDIRAHVQLPSLFSNYGCECTPQFVNLCLTIQLSIFLDESFMGVCGSLFLSLHVTLKVNVVPLIHTCVLSVNLHLKLVLNTVVSLVGGLLGGVLRISSGVTFPCLSDVIVIVEPTCPCSSHHTQLNGLCPSCSTCRPFGIPHPSLGPAKSVFDLISFC